MPERESVQVARKIKLASVNEEPVPSQRLSDLAYERVLEALRDLTSPRALVIRDG